MPILLLSCFLEHFFSFILQKMITGEQIQDILSLYTRYGWTLRRALLTDKLEKSLTDSIENLFRNSEIRVSQIDAVWFSRPSENDKEAWELRRLSETPYALFEVFEADDEEEVREEIRLEMEAKLNS